MLYFYLTDSIKDQIIYYDGYTALAILIILLQLVLIQYNIE